MIRVLRATERESHRIVTNGMQHSHFKMRGKGRFLKTSAGYTYFAVVEVEVDESSDGIQVIESLGPADPANGVISREMAPAWVEAAMRGARDIATRLAKDHILAHGCRIDVKRIVGTLVDTREDVVACAAGLATWLAICGESREAPIPVFEDGRWALS